MKIQCPQCSTVYSIDGSKIPAKGGRITCRKCKNKIHIPGVSQIENQEKTIDSLTEEVSEEALVDKYIKGKDEDAMVKSLYDGIIEFASQKKFFQAELLREKLMDIAPMAITEIIKTGEIIEEKKAEAMDREQIQPWSDLIDKLTESETVAFYFSLKELTAKEKKPLFEQGTYDNRLYFIRSGHLELTYYDNEKNKRVVVAVLEKGDIAGADTFFSFTNHTTTLISLEESDVFFLERNTFEKILNDNPAIEAKLFDYCKRQQKAYQVENTEGSARRTHERHQVSLRGQAQRVDTEGNRLGDFSTITIVDISDGGLCYMLRRIHKNEAADLQASWINIKASYNTGSTTQEFSEMAKVVSVQILPFEECSVHVKFKNPLEEEQLQAIAQCPAKDG